MTSAPPGYPKTEPRPTQCRHPVALGYLAASPTPGQPSVGIIEARCKSWRCEGCGRRLRQLHGQLIEAGFYEHLNQRGERFARFLTVTWPTDTGARLASAADCAATSAMFRRFVQEIRRHYSPRMEYYVVKEPTRRGRLHLHAVTFGPYFRKCRRTLPGTGDPCHRPGGCQAGPGRRPCVQAIAHRVGLGWLDVRVVRGQRHAAAYVAKYLGKDHIGHPWPRHSRRASYSRDFAPTTIGRLGAEWSARALAAGIAAGHLRPRELPEGATLSWYLVRDVVRGPPAVILGHRQGHGWTMDLERGTVRRLGSTQAADLDTGEVVEAPLIDLTELAWLRRIGRRTEEAASALLPPPDLALADSDLRRMVYNQARRTAYQDAGLAVAP